MAKLLLIDVGVNLLDDMFRGLYNGKQKHSPDVLPLLARAKRAGVAKIIVTSGNLAEAIQSHHMVTSSFSSSSSASASTPSLFGTIGVHPTRCNEFLADNDENRYFAQLRQLGLAYQSNCKHLLAAIGECGIDYDRLQFCDKTTQRKFFEKQFALAEEFGKPMFLHMRGNDEAFADFYDIVQRNRHRFTTGVVHSFDGTLAQATAIVSDLNLFIGINGCSLKTADNLGVVAALPIDRIMIETDAPWCSVKPSHAASGLIRTQFAAVKAEKKLADDDCLVRDRNEPACLIQILEIVAALHKIDVAECAEIIYANTCKVFFPEQHDELNGGVVDWSTMARNVALLHSKDNDDK